MTHTPTRSSSWFGASSASEEDGVGYLESLWTTVTGDEKYDLHDKRVTVLRLHIAELTKQGEAQTKDLAAAHATVKNWEAKAKAHGPMERKLFAKLEATQAELRKAREAKRRAEAAAQAHADELAALAECGRRIPDASIVAAGSAHRRAAPGTAAASLGCGAAGGGEDEDLTAPSSLLLRATCTQLDSVKALLRDAEASAEVLEMRVSQAEAAARRAEEEAGAAAGREADADRKLSAMLARAAMTADLTLPPPTKGGDIEAQHHILQLNFRHVSAELARKTAAADGLAAQRDAIAALLAKAQATAKEAREVTRAEVRERLEETSKRLTSQAEDLARQEAAIGAIRRDLAEGTTAKVSAVGAAAAERGLVRNAARAAVRDGALRATAALVAADSSRLGAAMLAATRRAEAAEAAAAAGRGEAAHAREEAAAAATAAAAVLASASAAADDASRAAAAKLVEAREATGHAVREATALQARLARAEAEAATAAARATEGAALVQAAEARAGQAAEVGAKLEEEARGRLEEAGTVRAARSEAATLRKALEEAKAREAAAAAAAVAAAAAAEEAAGMELAAVRAAAETRVEEARTAGRAYGSATATADAEAATERAAAAAAASQRKMSEELSELRSKLVGAIARAESAESAAASANAADAADAEAERSQHSAAAEAVAASRMAAAVAEAEGGRRVRAAEALAESANARAASLAEELVRERIGRELAAEQLSEMARGAGADGELQTRLVAAREACAEAKGEATALQHQMAQAQATAEGARRREAEASRRAEGAEARAKAAANEAEAARADLEAQKRTLSAERSRQLQEGAAREAVWSGRHSALQQEAAALRGAMGQQQEWAASQISQLQEALRSAQAGGRVGDGLGDSAGGGALVDLMDAPNLPGPRVGLGAAQLALAEQRAAAAGEYRELADGWKRKAERLGEALEEAKEVSESQAAMWVEQLQALRVRARSEQRRVAELETEVRRLGGAVSGAASDFGSPAEPARSRSREATGSYGGEPASAGRERAVADAGRGEVSRAPEKLRDGMGKILTKVDGRLDGVFDKMDGLAARLTRGTGVLRERLVRDEDRE